jgi:adenine-specific DNA-methyltransferase
MNYLIQSDNLPALQKINQLKKEFIDLIYIDPPYNTGKKMGKYNDSFQSHENWVEFMRPRLKESLPLLKNTGMIFISIGDEELAHLKLLCNEIFDEKNFVSIISWQSKYTVSNDKNGITSQIEYIIVYAKDIKLITINNDLLREDYVSKTYKNPDNDPRGLWRGGVQLWKKKNPNKYTVTSPNGKQWTMPWNYSKESWEEKLVKNDLIYWGKGGNSCPVKKVFLKDTKGKGITNLWLGEDVGYTADGGNTLEAITGERNDFIYPKPVSLMDRIIQIAGNKESIIMDYFAGSGTMGQAVLESNKADGGNRQFILITNNENEICEQVTSKRLTKVINGYTSNKGVEVPGTGGDFEYIIDLERLVKI